MSSEWPISSPIISASRGGMWTGGSLPGDINTHFVFVRVCVCVFESLGLRCQRWVQGRIDLITAAIVQPHPRFLTFPFALSFPSSLGFNRFRFLVSPPVFFFFVLFTSSPTPPYPSILTIPPSFPPLFPFSPPPAEKVTSRHKHPPIPSLFSPSLFSLV